MFRSAPILALLLLTLAVPLAAAPAEAIYVCGDGVCQTWGFPPESPQNCQADCGYCGDGICGYPENCSSCVNDCSSTCLNYTLSSTLKKSGCSGDDDGDCLDNALETDLAWVVAPWYFYDEDENCSGAWYTQGPVSSLHYGRRDFVQVRPAGSRVDLWSSGSSPKTVWVTFFLLHPHDCQSHTIFGFGGHQGDSEHVRYELKSLDLRKWVITKGEYHHHGTKHDFSGAYLRARASEIGTSYVSVAGDEDGHGSWPGQRGSSSACAGSEDDICPLGRCDCFRGTMAGAFTNGYFDLVSASQNVGGPSPERWRTSVVATFGGGAYNWMDVGHGQVREYWTPVTDAWKKFCGWECSARYSSGDCGHSIHGESGCSSALSEKVDTRYFTNGLATSSVVVEASQAAGAADAADLARLRREVGDTLYSVWRLPVADAAAWQERLEASADPVAAVVPALAGRPPHEKVRTLRWMLEVAPEKVDGALAEGLLGPRVKRREEREAIAVDLLNRLALLLESRGHGSHTPLAPIGLR